MTELKLHRDGQCNAGIGCNQVYRYEWDEVGRLVTAKRWDQNVTGSADPSGNADVELHYVYDAGDMRVIKRAVDTTIQLERYSEQLYRYLRKLGATRGKNAPNWKTVPRNDLYSNPMGPEERNESTRPIYTSEKK